MDMWGAGVGWCSEGGVSVREGGNTPWQRWAGYCVLATSAGMYYLSQCAQLPHSPHRPRYRELGWRPGW